MSAPISEPAELPGTTVYDQQGSKLGTVGRLYAPGGEGDPMWATLELSGGLPGISQPTVLLPFARFKEERGAVVVPYSRDHILAAPTVEPSDAIAQDDDRALRDYYGVDRGDAPTDSSESYAAQVPESDAPSEPLNR